MRFVRMSAKGIIACIATLMLSASVFAADRQEASPVIAPEPLIASTDAECDEDDHACLIRYLTRRITSERRNTRLYFERAKAHLEAKNYSSAAKDYTRYLQTNPDDTDALYGRGLSLSSLGRDREAIKDYGRAIRLDPANANFYLARGYSLEELGKQKEAVADYSRAIEFDPNMSQLYFNRATAVEDADPAAAYADYSKVIELDPDSAQAYTNRAIILIGRGEFDKAVTDLDAALKLAPGDAEAYYYLGFAKWSLGDLNAGIENLSRAIELDPNDAENLEIRARAYDQIGESAKAGADRAAAARIKRAK
jgi:Flp pilus assembly protein TadD